ncbi:MAG: AAA family ATPase [Oligoflexia bacterium]|nr:AAA family ATPase [Oligoflexia bacterium]
MEFPRALDLRHALASKSHFLFGPRGVGKTTLIRKTLPQDYQLITLLRGEDRLRLLENPSHLRRMIDSSKKGVVIDEIQKIPALLDEIQDLIEEEKLRFLLTGSSARKLKRQSANLLGGRARVLEMFGVTHMESLEIPLETKLRYGSLPAVLLSDDPWADLKAYTDTYLKEEIEEEAAVRNLGHFVRFLKVAALQSGNLLNLAAVSSDAGVPETTVRAYFEILKDTLIGFWLEPWRESKKRKAIRTAKFYLFDPGVQAALIDRKELSRTSVEFGVALEHWILHELRAYRSYRKTHAPITFWRSTASHEVDFCLGDKIAIEVKSTRRLTDRHFHGLKALREEKVFKRYVMVSFDESVRRWEGDFECFSVERFLTALSQGAFDT